MSPVLCYFADKDTTTRAMLEKILGKEEEHASDMHDLLISHQGQSLDAEPCNRAAKPNEL